VEFEAADATGVEFEAAPEAPLAADATEVEFEDTPEAPLVADVPEVETDQEALDPSSPEV
jgi:hypothetical protein